ncbi:hypothetical protein CDS [Bradyrhizobium sp.]|nr:hypothetical protein CDS [Bradyrhizobium sp.]
MPRDRAARLEQAWTTRNCPRRRSNALLAATRCVRERFRAKWIPVGVKKTRQNKNREPRSDCIGTRLSIVRTSPRLP